MNPQQPDPQSGALPVELYPPCFSARWTPPVAGRHRSLANQLPASNGRQDAGTHYAASPRIADDAFSLSLWWRFPEMLAQMCMICRGLSSLPGQTREEQAQTWREPRWRTEHGKRCPHNRPRTIDVSRRARRGRGRAGRRRARASRRSMRCWRGRGRSRTRPEARER